VGLGDITRLRGLVQRLRGTPGVPSGVIERIGGLERQFDFAGLSTLAAEIRRAADGGVSPPGKKKNPG
jgi:hypothetical protein